MAAVERHDAELHAVAAEQPRAGGVGIGGCGGVHFCPVLVEVLSAVVPAHPISGYPRSALLVRMSAMADMRREPIFQRPWLWVPACAGTTACKAARTHHHFIGHSW